MLNERKILVTGSSSGIGQAITSKLLKAEVNVPLNNTCIYDLLSFML